MLLERSYATSRKHGGAGDQLADLVHLALVYRQLGQQERAIESLRTALALAEEAAVDFLPGVLNALGHLMLEKGELAQAEGYYHRCLAIEEEIGDTCNLGALWLSLGYVAWQRADIERAVTCWQSARTT